MIMWARHEVAGYCMMSYDNDVLRSQHTDTEPVVQQLANSVTQNVQPLWQRIGSAIAVTDQFAGTKAPAHSNTGFVIPWHWPGGFPRKAKCKVLNIKSGHDGRLMLQKTLWQPDFFFLHIPCVNYTSLLNLEKSGILWQDDNWHSQRSLHIQVIYPSSLDWWKHCPMPSFSSCCPYTRLAPSCTALGTQTATLSAHPCFHDACCQLFDWPTSGSNRQKFSMVNSDRQSKICLHSAVQTAFPLPPFPNWNDRRRLVTAQGWENLFRSNCHSLIHSTFNQISKNHWGQALIFKLLLFAKWGTFVMAILLAFIQQWHLTEMFIDVLRVSNKLLPSLPAGHES